MVSPRLIHQIHPSIRRVVRAQRKRIRNTSKCKTGRATFRISFIRLLKGRNTNVSQSIENVGESAMSEMVLTTEQKAWNPGKAGTDATKAGDSPSRGRVEDMIWVPTT